MLKLEDSPRESLLPGCISEINDTGQRGAGSTLTFFEKSRFYKQNSQDILAGAVGLGLITRYCFLSTVLAN